MQFTHGSCNWPYNIDFRIFDFYIRGYSVEECATAITDQYINCSPEMFLMAHPLEQQQQQRKTTTANNKSKRGKSVDVEKKILAALGNDFSAYLASSVNGLLVPNNNNNIITTSSSSTSAPSQNYHNNDNYNGNNNTNRTTKNSSKRNKNNNN